MQWCEIFKTGKHKDSKGNVREWTLCDLQTIKQNFETKNPDVPICAGHPKSNSPAYGWVDGLKIEQNKENGFSLFSKFKNVQEDFKEAVNKRLYKTRSISLTPDLMIRHLAFLGGQTPAVKRLEEFCFSDDENDLKIEFETNADCEQRQQVETDEVSTETPFNASNQEAEDDDIAKLPQGKPIADGGVPSAPPQKIINERKIIVDEKEFQAQLKSKEDEIVALKKQLDEEKKAKQIQEFEDFCDKAIENGNILPAQKNAVIDILTASIDYEPFEFSDGNAKTVVEMVKNLIGNMKQFDYNSTAAQDKVIQNQNIDFSDTDSIVAEIKRVQAEYKEKGLEISNLEAMNIIHNNA